MLLSWAWHTRLSPDCCLDPLRLARARAMVEALSIRESSGVGGAVEGPQRPSAVAPGCPHALSTACRRSHEERQGVLGD